MLSCAHKKQLVGVPFAVGGGKPIASASIVGENVMSRQGRRHMNTEQNSKWNNALEFWITSYAVLFVQTYGTEIESAVQC